MKKTVALLKSVVYWLDDNKKVIGLVFASLVTLVGLDTATEQDIIPTEITPPVIQRVIDSGA